MPALFIEQKTNGHGGQSAGDNWRGRVFGEQRQHRVLLLPVVSLRISCVQGDWSLVYQARLETITQAWWRWSGYHRLSGKTDPRRWQRPLCCFPTAQLPGPKTAIAMCSALKMWIEELSGSTERDSQGSSNVPTCFSGTQRSLDLSFSSHTSYISQSFASLFKTHLFLLLSGIWLDKSCKIYPLTSIWIISNLVFKSKASRTILMWIFSCRYISVLLGIWIICRFVFNFTRNCWQGFQSSPALTLPQQLRRALVSPCPHLVLWYMHLWWLTNEGIKMIYKSEEIKKQAKGSLSRLLTPLSTDTFSLITQAQEASYAFPFFYVWSRYHTNSAFKCFSESYHSDFSVSLTLRQLPSGTQ